MLLGKQVSPSASPVHRPVRVPGSGAGAAGLDAFELPGSAGGLKLVGTRLRLPVLDGDDELGVEVELVSVGHGLDELAVALGAGAGDLGELRAGALLLPHPLDFALG